MGGSLHSGAWPRASARLSCEVRMSSVRLPHLHHCAPKFTSMHIPLLCSGCSKLRDADMLRLAAEAPLLQVPAPSSMRYLQTSFEILEAVSNASPPDASALNLAKSPAMPCLCKAVLLSQAVLLTDLSLKQLVLHLPRLTQARPCASITN